MELAGKVALVTGAGSGIGEASARLLASSGAHVAALDVVAASLARVNDEIVAAGGTITPLLADVADEAQMRTAVEALLAKCGRLDIVVACAGINGMWSPIEELLPHEFDRTIAVNLRGTYLTLHLAVPHLKAAGGGAIVIIASINGNRTFTTAGASAYSATKAGQVAMSNQLAIELGLHRIRVNAICPGSTRTNLGLNTQRRNIEAARYPVIWPEGDVPITHGEPAAPEDIAEAVAFLVSDRARHVTGDVLYIDGGQSLLR
jgi:NAD(P)-dependent dehydrogenase (short-subunit alcohol dehydrogenase family)